MSYLKIKLKTLLAGLFLVGLTMAGANIGWAGAAPFVAGIDPNSGPLAGGTLVTIYGQNFEASSTVKIGGSFATQVVLDSTGSLTAITPIGSTPGAKDVLVTNPDNQSGLLSGGFTYLSPVTLYHLSVIFGSGSGDYPAGSSVTIVANAPPVGQEFDHWATSGSLIIANPFNSTTSVVIPENGYSLTVVARYKDIPVTKFHLDVINGSGTGDYQAFSTITVVANPPPAGKEFDTWIASGAVIINSNPQFPTAYVMLNNGNGLLIATYKDIPVTKYHLTVINGSGTGDYQAFSTITVVANPPPAGKEFDTWIASGAVIINSNPQFPTAYVMLNNGNGLLIATYKDIPVTKYHLTVINGSGTGDYPAGSSVTIVANPPPSGQEFDHWVASGSLIIANPFSPTTAVIIQDGAYALTVVATYKPAPALSHLTVVNGSGTGDYQVNTNIPIIANPAPTGKEFDQWLTSGAVTVADRLSPSTNAKLQQDAYSATVIPTYKDVVSTPTLTISNIQVAIGSNQVMINWKTNIPANSQVECSTPSANGGFFLSVFDPALLTQHSLSITGLRNGVVYHYRIRSVDALGNMAISNEGSFTPVNLSSEPDKEAVLIQKGSQTIASAKNGQSPKLVLNLPESGDIEIGVFDRSGRREIKTIHTSGNAGIQTVSNMNLDLPFGVYRLKIKLNGRLIKETPLVLLP